MANQSDILVTGSCGQLGTDLMRLLSGKYHLSGFDVDSVDITDADAVMKAVTEVGPSVVLHAAAYTDVDGCEADPDLAMRVNGEGTVNVARACRACDARLVYYSTDYVFDGEKESGYVEVDRPSPRTAYGRSKLVGEEAVKSIAGDWAIMRIAWVYGAHGKNFVKTMLHLGRERVKDSALGPLKVVNDQVGNPTWTEDIVGQTAVVIDKQLDGILHATAEGSCSWYDLACEIFRLAGMPVTVEPCTTEEFPRPAPRPRFSSLENARLKIASANVMRHYQEALTEFLTGFVTETHR